MSSKADEGALREVERRVVGVARTAEHASEGVRGLTQSTYKRVDEHASAIQRLTLVGVCWGGHGCLKQESELNGVG